MPFTRLVRDFKDITDNVGTISCRALEVKLSHSRCIHSQSVASNACTDTAGGSPEHDCWANLPPEPLRDILARVESAGGFWPARKDVVACSAVCKTWRKVMQALVKALEDCGKLTFPLSLKQPGLRDGPLQCFIRRDRINSIYYLYLGLSPSLSVEDCKFLLVARKVRRVTSTDYVISLSTDDMSEESTGYVGRLRSNFLGTKFTVYDSDPPLNGAVISTSLASKHIGYTKVSPKVPRGSYNVAHIAYELNFLGTRGPRRIQSTLHTIPTSCMDIRGIAPTSMELISDIRDSFSSSLSKPLSDISSRDHMNLASKASPLILRNKAPRWHEHLQCWCLNFRGRVTVASVKNFQLVASVEASVPQGEQDKVLLQFGKIGKDMFTMDYRYPLSAFQAFAICLSSFDTKLACE